MPTCKTKPSKRQALILNHIRTSLQDRGFPPSIRELCAAVGLSSSSTVHSHLTALERKGFIKREPGQPRSTALVEPGPSRVQVLEGLLRRGVEISNTGSDMEQYEWRAEVAAVLPEVA